MKAPLPDREVPEFAGADLLSEFKPFHHGRGRPLTAPVNQGIHGVIIALEHAGDGTVRQVPDPAVDAKFHGSQTGVVTKRYPLNPAENRDGNLDIHTVSP